jgi:hypothetical protein
MFEDENTTTRCVLSERPEPSNGGNLIYVKRSTLDLITHLRTTNISVAVRLELDTNYLTSGVVLEKVVEYM